jgi:hypothetical protein
VLRVPEVVAGAGEGHAHEIAVLEDGLDQRGHNHREDIARACGEQR